MNSRRPFKIFFSLAAGLLLQAQIPGPPVVSAEPAPAVVAHRGSTAEIPLRLAIRSGYHINSNTPAEDYLIPTLLSWNEAAGLAPRGVTYPKSESVKYEFAEKPLLVYSGAVTVTTRFAVAADATPGPQTLSGKLRYQACTDRMCLPPRTLNVSASIKVE